VLETSLGYFITPQINVLLGFLFLGERLRRIQWLAVALAAAVAANFLEAELVAVEIQRRVEIGHAYHCVQIAHHLSSREFN
jgi:RarD protein